MYIRMGEGHALSNHKDLAMNMSFKETIGLFFLTFATTGALALLVELLVNYAVFGDQINWYRVGFSVQAMIIFGYLGARLWYKFRFQPAKYVQLGENKFQKVREAGPW